jgi:hypothetical protein
MKTLTPRSTAQNLTGRLVSVLPGQTIPTYTVLEESMKKQTGFQGFSRGEPDSTNSEIC